MKRPTFKQRFGYWFDNMMAKGTPAMIFMLFLASAIVILFISAVVAITGVAPNGENFFQLSWMGMLRTLDPGTMGSDSGSPLFLFMMFSVTLGGIFLVSALIGILNSGLDKQLERLRKGRSRVLENGHTLILGWSPQVFTILSELMTANENQKNARIVILANRDKVEMEEQIRERVKEIGNTRVIVRSGNPIDLNDLEIVSPHTARSIIILPPESDDPDAYVIKTVLALTNNPNRHEEPYHIVTQIHDEKNMAVVEMIGRKDKVLALLMNDLIARVVAQTSRQSGLSIVYTELMNFGGDEIYFKKEPTISGKTFGEALFLYEDSALMGLKKVDGSILLNPPMDARIEPGDSIFALSKDDNTIQLAGLASIPIQESLIRPKDGPTKHAPEKALILGWNLCAATIIHELDEYVVNGSQVTVVAQGDGIGREVNTCTRKAKNQKVTFIEGDTTSRELLDSLEIRDLNHVIVLAYDGLDNQEADAKTLVTLLHLRHIAETDKSPFSIVSEMLDLRNRELAEAAKVDDFIVSDHLVSLMLAQLAEDADLYPVFQDIFDPEGSEIYLKPISRYVETGQPVNFYTVVEAARQRNETAIGYRVAAEANNPEKNHGVHTNPKKSEKVIFTPADKIIVVAED
jgi:voltage-gated potassium channel Kch